MSRTVFAHMMSLFTNTPIPRALEVIRQRLVRGKTMMKLEVDAVMECLEFVLTTMYFIF